MVHNGINSAKLYVLLLLVIVLSTVSSFEFNLVEFPYHVMIFFYQRLCLESSGHIPCNPILLSKHLGLLTPRETCSWLCVYKIAGFSLQITDIP